MGIARRAAASRDWAEGHREVAGRAGAPRYAAEVICDDGGPGAAHRAAPGWDSTGAVRSCPPVPDRTHERDWLVRRVQADHGWASRLRHLAVVRVGRM